MDEDIVKVAAIVLIVVFIIIPVACNADPLRETCTNIWNTLILFLILLGIFVITILLYLAYENGYLNWLTDRI